MDGHLHIEPGVPPGDHGLIISIDGKEKFRNIGMIRIVHPEYRKNGIHSRSLRRKKNITGPAISIQIYVQATGLSAQDPYEPRRQSGRSSISENPPSLIFLPRSCGWTLTARPPCLPDLTASRSRAPAGSCFTRRKIYSRSSPPIGSQACRFRLAVKAGGKSTLKILGRDFSDAFVAAFHIDVDEPGISVTGLKRETPHCSTARHRGQRGRGAPGTTGCICLPVERKSIPPMEALLR